MEGGDWGSLRIVAAPRFAGNTCFTWGRRPVGMIARNRGTFPVHTGSAWSSDTSTHT
jgi:hypothetical protein